MYLFRIVLLSLFFCISLFANPFSFDLKHPSVTKKTKTKFYNYDILEVYYKKKRESLYGQTLYENFKYPKIEDGTHFQKIKTFFVKQLDIKDSDINKKGVGHFFKGEDEYYLKLDVYATSYSYKLLKVGKTPNIVSFKKDAKYNYTNKTSEKKYSKYPKNILFPVVKNFGINRLDYKKYNEKIFLVNKEKFKKNGEYWKVNYTKISKDKENYRYSISHDYKMKIVKLGAKILDDKDNVFVFTYEEDGNVYFTKFSSYHDSLTLEIIKEEAFQQSLVLSPDKIKTLLDKEGKITLDGIFFDFNKATLKKESKKAILSAVSLMEQYSDLVISIHGHTDSKGNDDYNYKLSLNRAKAVKDAIVASGINSNRITSKGFGETKAIASNETEEGRAKNRRVELHKVSGGDKKAIITIDFIKPIENSKITLDNTYKNIDILIRYTKPYSDKKQIKKYHGTQKRIDYMILKDGKVDKAFSRESIIKNYKNIFYLYNGKILGEYSNTLYFIIEDRGDGKTVYGKINAFDGSYSINFLIEE